MTPGGVARAFSCRRHHHRGCPAFAFYEPRTRAASVLRAHLRRAITKRNLAPTRGHTHRSGFVKKIETIAAPSPLFRGLHQSSLHRVAMHVPQLLDAFFRRPHVEVVETCLPEGPGLRSLVDRRRTAGKVNKRFNAESSISAVLPQPALLGSTSFPANEPASVMCYLLRITITC